MNNLRWWLRCGMIVGILGSLIFLRENSMASEKRKENVIPYSQFLDEVEAKKVKEVKIICQETIEGEYIDNSKFITQIPYYDENLIGILKKMGLLFGMRKSH